MDEQTLSSAFEFCIDTRTEFGTIAKEMLKDFIQPKGTPIPEGYVALNDHDGMAKAFASIRAIALKHRGDQTSH